MTQRNAASERQVQAADPAASTWLSANAGSGKTRVLTDRVARLLLRGVEPQHILCLTYTKAAASEMQNRLFDRLGAWAMLEDSALRDALEKLGLHNGVREDDLRAARRLFARAIETPGGLKIQTIHSFCASLLRRFPLEAGVTPQFVEMDDRAAALLREEVVEELANGRDVAAVDAIARIYTGEDFSSLTAEIARHRAAFATPLTREDAWALFDLPAGYGEADLLAGVFLGHEADLIQAILPVLARGSATDLKDAAKLQRLCADQPGLADLTLLEGVFLTGASAKAPFTAKTGSFPTKATRAALGPRLDPLEALMLRVEAARPRRLALMAARKTLALHRFAGAFLPEYAARKARRGWLDFDDLIHKARALLTDPSVAQWVLFRLDGGIDHILVDEAQDTSPEQWKVIELLAQEFTAGRGARAERLRTIFVVGDKKQSIYSFQGADLRAFERMRDHFRTRLAEVKIGLQNLTLEYSFRSADPVLRVVDLTFDARNGRGLGGDVKHLAFHADLPGRVDLWPPIEKVADPEPAEWHDPVDMISGEHHAAQLARRIAAEIRRMIDSGTAIPDDKGPRPVREGDFLILVRRRSDLFQEIIRACKAERLAIAGADRLKLGGELAIKDLAALLAFLATPEDSLSLAAALRSPLLGWDERGLYALAQGREDRYLWRTLQARAAEYPETLALLTDLRDQADFLRPYDLIERVLTRHHGRRNFLARLGPEAEDGIDAFLAQALAYERMEVPSLTGFLNWLQTDDVEIKRQMDAAGNRIRVMTVHGAKGLEAPIVILPDTAKRDLRIRDEIYETGPGAVVWQTRAEDSPPLIAQARDDLRRRQEEEALRLLYVAMTRAEKWLITCAAGDLGKDGQSWYDLIRHGMETAGASGLRLGPQDFPFGTGLRLEHGDWPAAMPTPAQGATAAPVSLEDWAHSVAPVPERPAAALSPSALGGAKALPGEGAGLEEEAAKRHGRQLHLLLEHLPLFAPQDRDRLARDLLAQSADGATGDEARDLLAETRAVLNAPDLAFLFTPDALAEVDITAQLGSERLLGTIDRLLITPERVLAVDFKSNAVIPATPAAVPDGILRQMGAYATALRQIYPTRRVDTAILWTRTGQLMALPADLVDAALCAATMP